MAETAGQPHIVEKLDQFLGLIPQHDHGGVCGRLARTPKVEAVVPGDRLGQTKRGAKQRNGAGLGVGAGVDHDIFAFGFRQVRYHRGDLLHQLAVTEHVGVVLRQGAQVRVYSPTVDNPGMAPTGDLVSLPSLPIPLRPDYRLASGINARIRADLAAFKPNVLHVSAPDLGGHRAISWARRNGVPVVASVHTRVLHPDSLPVFVRARDVLLDVIAEWGADLVALGSQGVTSWQSVAEAGVLRAGSTASGVAAHSPCSVLIARG